MNTIYRLFSILLCIEMSTAYANYSYDDWELDYRVQQLAEDLMKKQYSYEEAFDIAIKEAKQCFHNKEYRKSRICQSYELWK